MSEKKPVVVRESSARSVCPVCGKPSYSATGTHPQCAMSRADDRSREDLKKIATEVSKTKRKFWSKPCPKCKREIPARRFVCDCGHTFAEVAAAKAPQRSR
ncbi:MAG: hypothetical protein JNG90_18730 [Planctomycetaceae bacterium]|nr:hypothetical protein [Planctomycetaceae bacterium]